MQGTITSINIGKRRGEKKVPVNSARLVKGLGIEGDAHANGGERQVSLLAWEDISSQKMKLNPGDFAENITTSGLDLGQLKLGDSITVNDAVLRVTKIGKTCHAPCHIYRDLGDCIMPRSGIFAEVIKGGEIKVGDKLFVIARAKPEAISQKPPFEKGGEGGFGDRHVVRLRRTPRDDKDAMHYKTAILTISDKGAKGERLDESGPALEKFMKENGYEIAFSKIIPDDIEEISSTLKRLADEGVADLILTTGGTGFSPRDVTPEATKRVIEKEAPGLCEMMRAASSKLTPRAYLSRAVAGIRKRSLIINLPGSPKGAVESIAAVMPVLGHALDILKEEVSECGSVILSGAPARRAVVAGRIP